MTWGHKHKPQDQLQGQGLPPQQGVQMPPQPALQAATPQEAEAIKRAHWQARFLQHALINDAGRLVHRTGEGQGGFLRHDAAC